MALQRFVRATYKPELTGKAKAEDVGIIPPTPAPKRQPGAFEHMAGATYQTMRNFSGDELTPSPDAPDEWDEPGYAT